LHEGSRLVRSVVNQSLLGGRFNTRGALGREDDPMSRSPSFSDRFHVAALVSARGDAHVLVGGLLDDDGAQRSRSMTL
jgi:hypothetical protein